MKDRQELERACLPSYARVLNLCERMSGRRERAGLSKEIFEVEVTSWDSEGKPIPLRSNESRGARKALANRPCVPLKTGEILQQRYHVNTVLKSGGMGSIYLAHDANLDGPCAIKEMHPTDDGWVTRRFREEANLLSQLQHPNIPHVRDFFQLEREGGTLCYIVMDFVQGVTLHHELELALKAEKKGIDCALARTITLDMLGVLEYLHALNPPIIHRDIKPANIIRDTENGKLYLVDFGLARGTSEHTQTTAGTLMFCPPEQMLGKADVRSDLYALGATLYLLLTGQPIQMGRYMPVLAHRADIEPQLAETVDKVLQLDPDQRFQNAAEMRDFLTRPYVVAAPPSPWPRRAGTAAVLVLALGLIGVKPLLNSMRPATPTATATPVGTPAAPPSSAPVAPPGEPDSDIHVVGMAAKPTWYVREKVFTAADLATAIERTKAELAEYTVPAGLNVPTYHRWLKYAPPEVELEAGVVLPKKMPSPGGPIEVGSLPEGEMITMTHRGDYNSLPGRYVEMLQWAAAKHLAVDEAPWGIYRVGPPAQLEPQKWETDVYYLIKAR